ncbi:MAG: OmpA family protein [Alphaproteobacteria bacterium]|nr:OmpA family protein [Alphaproteobacteria bacterium]
MLKFRERTNTWPGFVDLFSNLVIILIFLLIVFIFLWTATNVFSAGGSGAKLIASLTRQNTEKTEEIEDLRMNEAQARELLILARAALETVEAEKVEKEQQNISLAELVAAYESKLYEMQSGEASMTQIIQSLESQLRAAEHDKTDAAELEIQKHALMMELSRINEMLGAAEARSAEAETNYVDMSARLNRALADKVAELNRMQDNLMDAEMRAALMGEFQSEFYRAVRTTLAGMPGVDVSSDRFVISSDILFATGSFELSPAGKKQIGLLAGIMKELEIKIPQDVNWIIRVDGHTDIQPVKLGLRGFANNTELSLLRARAVVDELVGAGVKKRRLIPSGFGEMYPVAPGRDAASLQKNRRIELRLTNP